MILIGHAKSDETGGGYHGASGDQTGREVMIEPYVDCNWVNILRPKNSTKAQQLAKYMKNACTNYHIGYDKSQRNTIYTLNGLIDPVEITNDCECDCSSLVCYCCANAGLMSWTTNFYTGNEVATLLDTGNFDRITLKQSTDLTGVIETGDILHRPGHTAIVIESNSDSSHELFGVKCKVNGKWYGECENDYQYTSGPVLPEGYTAVEYIRSEGTQLLLSETFNASTNEDIRIEFTITESRANTALLSAQNSLDVGIVNSKYGIASYSTSWSTQYLTPQTNYESDKKLWLISSSTVSVPDLSISTNIPQTIGTGRIRLFYSFKNNRNCQGNVYSYKHYRDGVLLSQLIPCRNPSNVAGFYNTVSKTFISPTTGSLIAGPDVVSVRNPRCFKIAFIKDKVVHYVDRIVQIKDGKEVYLTSKVQNNGKLWNNFVKILTGYDTESVAALSFVGDPNPSTGNKRAHGMYLFKKADLQGFMKLCLDTDIVRYGAFIYYTALPPTSLILETNWLHIHSLFVTFATLYKKEFAELQNRYFFNRVVVSAITVVDNTGLAFLADPYVRGMLSTIALTFGSYKTTVGQVVEYLQDHQSSPDEIVMYGFYYMYTLTQSEFWLELGQKCAEDMLTADGGLTYIYSDLYM